ncbi:VOC family protein [uncultured Planococcus sp.]|uniref:VOC family protein n=1 Tax=uncultured Planococcus sp. TaxID=337815 RepID=UPI00260AA301|nr:VOC family protein [uncultured Planococcus sp.]
MKITHLDHLVLTVSSIEESCRFYEQVLGMEVIRFGEGRTALKFGNQKINLHETGKEFEPKAATPTAGSGDLCFITESSVKEITAHLAKLGVEIEEGPVKRTGALGKMDSVYLRDPDGNLLEVLSY